MSKTKQKPYPQMTTDELAAATADLDREHVGTPGRSLNRREREEHRKARKLGRPKVGQGVKVISLSVEQALLKRTDALAKRRKMTRAQLVAEALKAVLAKAG